MENKNKDIWEIKSRYVIMFFILAYLFGMIIWGFITPSYFDDNPPPLSEASFSYFIYAFLFYFGFKLSKKANVYIKDLIGKNARSKFSLNYVMLVIPLIGISIGGLYLIFYPISFWFPEFTEFWILDNQINLFWISGDNYKLANLLSYVDIAVLTPLWEEIFFRGFLFTSLAVKYNVKKATLISSLLFGFGHGDVIGAMIFGIVLTYIYLITKSLFIPIIIHVINNTIVYLIVSYSVIFGSGEEYTLTELQNDWWMGLVGLVISLPWLYKFYKSKVANKSFKIPYFQNSGA